jgi:hypothetical protein
MSTTQSRVTQHQQRSWDYFAENPDVSSANKKRDLTGRIKPIHQGLIAVPPLDQVDFQLYIESNLLSVLSIQKHSNY